MKRAPSGNDAPDGLNRTAVFQQTTRYVLAIYGSRALCAVRGLINARSLGPELYGFWSSLAFLLSFGFYLQAGVQDSAARDLPMARARDDQAAARQTTQVAFTFLLVVLAIPVLGLWLTALALPSHTPSLIRAGWGAAGIVLPLEILWLFDQVLARAEERFKRLSWSLLITSAVSLLLTGWLVVSFGLAGLLVVAVVTPTIGVGLLRRGAGYPWRLSWSWDRLASMLHAGWSILAMTLVFEALGWIDRLLVLRLVGVEGFGYYSLAVILSQLCGTLPTALASVVEPRLYADYARTPQVSAVWDHLWFPLRTLAWLMPVGLAVVDWALPALVARWLPAYRPGIPAMRVLVWSSGFMGLLLCTKAFIIALGEQRRVLGIYACAIGVNVLVSTALARVGWGLAGIAWGTAAAYAVCCTALLIFAFRRAGGTGAWIVRRVASLYLPAVLVVGLTQGVPVLLGQMVPSWIGRTGLLHAVGLAVAAVLTAAQMRCQTRRERARDFDQDNPMVPLSPALSPEVLG